MRKISEKELKQRGVKLKADDLGRIATSKSSKVLSDVSRTMQETVKVLGQISKEFSMEFSKHMTVNADAVKPLVQGKDEVQKVEIVGGDKSSKQWRVRITGRDRNGLISEIIMEQV